jgi:hypothetical protein
MIPFILTAVFLTIRASSIDHTSADGTTPSGWQPHLLTSLSPVITIIGIGAIASCAGAVILTRELPTIYPTALPLDLREHTDPPADAVLPANFRPAPSVTGLGHNNHLMGIAIAN